MGKRIGNMAEQLMQADAIVNRRSRFRAYMQRFNPTAFPEGAIRDGLVVEGGPDSIHGALAVRAELEPGSQQVIVGGIGSGKTTELLLTLRDLQDQPDILAFYVDISAETDLVHFSPGARFGKPWCSTVSDAGSLKPARSAVGYASWSSLG